METLEVCCEDDRQRRADARAKGLNGIDFVEVGRDARTLKVYFFLKAPAVLDASHVSIEGGVRVRGLKVIDVRDPESIDLRVDDAIGQDRPGGRTQDQCAAITVDRRGDFSTYVLSIRGIEGFDPHYTRCSFRFRTSSANGLDCSAVATGGEIVEAPPQIDYLAKDYASLRQLMLDRLALVMPDWQETHVPDVGIVLVEILAYVADYLSYYQDAVATEAYLDTARQRVSVKRHARLVDYHVHEGCNARAWVCIEADADVPAIAPADCLLVTDAGTALAAADAMLSESALLLCDPGSYESYVPMGAEPIEIRSSQSAISFYAWGASHYVLPAGTTRASLLDRWAAAGASDARSGSPAKPYTDQDGVPESRDGKHVRRALDALKVGDFLVFEEVTSPLDGTAGGADSAHRHVVRLTHLERAIDPVYEQPVLHIEWAAADALPFPLVLATVGAAPDCAYLGPPRSQGAAGFDIVLARGNVLLVDHGVWVENEELQPRVPLVQTNLSCDGEGKLAAFTALAGTFRPRLAQRDLTYCDALRKSGPADGLLAQAVQRALPQIGVTSIPGSDSGEDALFQFADLDDPDALIGRLKTSRDAATSSLRERLSRPARHLLRSWTSGSPIPEILRESVRADLTRMLLHWCAQPDLIGSGPDDRHVVVEIDEQRRVQLRFGDGQCGSVPTAGSRFRARYRIGEGPIGNVGAEAITHLVVRGTNVHGGVKRVWNPFPARGGTSPETLADVRVRAPTAFRDDLARAITAQDYERLALRHAQVQRASARLRWTGSRHVVKLAIDPFGSETPSAGLLREIERSLEPYRRIGHELEVTAAAYVPLDVRISVRVAAGHDLGTVKAEMLSVLGHGVGTDGRLGLFHADRLSFGDSVFLSHIVAAAQGIPGVWSLVVTRFQRLFHGPNQEIETGVLKIAGHEIAQLDNDPNFPEHGSLRLDMRGGS